MPHTRALRCQCWSFHLQSKPLLHFTAHFTFPPAHQLSLTVTGLCNYLERCRIGKIDDERMRVALRSVMSEACTEADLLYSGYLDFQLHQRGFGSVQRFRRDCIAQVAPHTRQGSARGLRGQGLLAT